MRINYNLGGENVSVVAEYDLYSKEAQARYVAKYAKALEVYGNNGQDLKGSISRSKISTGKAKFNGPRIRPGQSQPFASLQNELSDTGRRFVALLFATH